MKRQAYVGGVTLVISLFLAGCGQRKQVETFDMEGFTIEAPAGTVPLKHNETELEIQMASTTYRFAREKAQWYVWQNGHRCAAFGETKRVILNMNGVTFE